MDFNVTALEGLAPNLWIFIAHIIAFAIIIIIIIIFAWKPTKKFLEDQKKKINKEIDEAKIKNQNADDLLQKANQKVLDSKKQAIKLQEMTEEKSHLYWEKSMNKAKNDAEQVREKALKDIQKKEIEFEKNKKKEITDIALLAAEQLIKKNLNSKDNKKLINSMLEELEKND